MTARRRAGAGTPTRRPKTAPRGDAIPRGLAAAIVRIGDRSVPLTNLEKVFWPELGLTKGDLLRHYLDVAPVLLPHLRDRPMVMRRYPDGVGGKTFFMKQVPAVRPPWLTLCAVPHKDDKVVEFPLVQDLASLLWVVNLGCIDLNPWYARCDDVNRPDLLYFDLDPGARASFARVCEAALVVHEALDALGMANHVKTTGSRGLHVAVPIVRGPAQAEVWAFAKALSHELARRHPALVTVEYARARRPADRVLLDYNQNAWGQTLASIYSVRPHPRAAVSTPVTWAEVGRGFALDDFRIDTIADRIARHGDLWKPVLARTGRAQLDAYLAGARGR